jgi:hypothetical protein
MRDPVSAILKAVARETSGIVVVWVPDLDLRGWVVDLVRGLTLELDPVQKTDVEGVLAEPSRLVLLVPQDERETVLDLEGSLDRLLEPSRTRPVVLFLERSGVGRALLAKSACLASWVRARDVDPEELAEIDVPKKRIAFESKHGVTPEVWLTKWRLGALPKSGENYRELFDATLLEVPE